MSGPNEGVTKLDLLGEKVEGFGRELRDQSKKIDRHIEDHNKKDRETDREIALNSKDIAELKTVVPLIQKSIEALNDSVQGLDGTMGSVNTTLVRLDEQTKSNTTGRGRIESAVITSLKWVAAMFVGWLIAGGPTP